ncbi:MAG: hypothetical protein ABIJ45_03700 [Candidatus Zixiibacteriota bacterium]
MHKYLRLIIFSSILILFGSGCYTIIQHPGEGNNYTTTSGETDCIRCHPHYHDDYGTSHLYYPDYWTTYERFGRYYAEPWWWDFYWYDRYNYSYDDDQTDNPRSDGGAKATRPANQYIGNDNYIPNITQGSSGSSASSGSSSSKQTEESSQTTVETKTRTDDSNDKKDSSKEATKKSGRMKKQ